MSGIESTYSAPAPEATGGDSVLYRVLNRLLLPVARLCIRHGMTFASVEEVLKRAFVQEAVAQHPELPEHGMVSRISAATGINRREVTRLTKEKAAERTVKQPLAAEILALWTTNTLYRDDAGKPRSLNRQGEEPSFETLAQTVTRDVHPRSMLEELIRLGLVQHDQALDQVTLLRTDFVPDRDGGQMLGLLADNVGDHLDAAVANVGGDGPRHLEQAIFADELSVGSVAALRPLITAHWQSLRDAVVPAITGLIEADRQAGQLQDQRIRIGLYSYAEADSGRPAPQKGVKAPRRFRKATQKESGDEN